MRDKRASGLEVQYLHGTHVRRCGGHRREGRCALPGEVCLLAHSYRGRKAFGMSRQKSAEGIVGPATGLKART